MLISRIRSKVLSTIYRWTMSGPRHQLAVTGKIHLTNPKSIYCGNNILIKRGADFQAGRKKKAIVIGNDCEIHENCSLRSSIGFIRIGSNVSINRSGIIHGAGGVTIKNNVRIGPRINIASVNHVFTDRNCPICQQGEILKPVLIEDDVWIGINVTIVPGITIGKGSIVAAGSVVTKNIAPYAIMAGVPAKKIGQR